MEGPDHRQRAKGLHVRSANWAHTLVGACRGLWEGNLALCRPDTLWHPRDPTRSQRAGRTSAG